MRCLTYLGNKRKFLEYIYQEVASLTPPGGLVLDLFSGSGVVSWYLRQKGYVVHANDIAGYSWPINQGNLAYTPESLETRFPDLNTEITRLNALECPRTGEEYFAKYYSENPGMKAQRLFYTKRNGMFIDAVLNEIHQPGYDADLKDVVLSDLLYKMSKHTNTNGHFKTFHKAFGGLTNRHDVERITTPIMLEKPDVLSGPVGKSWCMDAETMVKSSDIVYNCVYLDPPYNQHQYSANYHLLEAACLPRQKRYIPKDSQVSGIDSRLYKSPYCSKIKCLSTLQNLLSALRGKSKSAVISYSSSGFITVDEMKDVLGASGKLVTFKPLESQYRIGTRKEGTAKKPNRDSKEYLATLVF